MTCLRAQHGQAPCDRHGDPRALCEGCQQADRELAERMDRDAIETHRATTNRIIALWKEYKFWQDDPAKIPPRLHPADDIFWDGVRYAIDRINGTVEAIEHAGILKR